MGRRSQEKIARRREEKDNPLTADGRRVISRSVIRFVPSSQRKIAIVADLIRNRTVAEAMEALEFTHRPSAVPHIAKALKSAIANARDLTPDPYDLVVGEVLVEGGPMMKRIRPASMGRAVRIRKRLSHLRIALTEY